MGIFEAVLGVANAVKEVMSAAKLGLEVLQMVCDALESIAKALGLVEREEGVDRLGDKALQAEEAGIFPDKFGTYAEYVRQVEAFETDPSRTALYTDAEKFIKGAELAAGLMAEEFPDLPVEPFFTYAANHPDYFTKPRMEALGDGMKEDPALLRDVLGYLDGSEKNDLRLDRTIGALVEIEKKADPALSDKDALNNVLNAGRVDG